MKLPRHLGIVVGPHLVGRQRFVLTRVSSALNALHYIVVIRIPALKAPNSHPESKPASDMQPHLSVDRFINVNDETATDNDVEAAGRNLALELVRVTEAAALAASQWMGRGDKLGADGAAVDAMRQMLSTIRMDGTVIIGEGEKDEAPMLFNGERIGDGSSPRVDIAVDPVDGTTLTALGQANAIAVIAASDHGTMFDPGPCVYMDKIAVGPSCKGVIDINASVAHNLAAVAKAKGESIENVTAVILERPRHEQLIAEVRSAGARIRLIRDGDVAGAISTAWPDSGADILMGIGGTPEGVIAAAALKCMGGEMQSRLHPRSNAELQATIDFGYDINDILTQDDLVKGNNCFFASTAITDGPLLPGVTYNRAGAQTNSLSMRSKSGTVRQIRTYHRRDKLGKIAGIDY